MNFLEINQENFGIIKFTGFVLCFFFVVTLQFLFPYKKMSEQIYRNWRVNIPLSIINTALLSVVCVSCACAWSLQMQELKIGIFNLVSLPIWASVILSILILDLIAYGWHRLNHHSPFLWRFHSVHHSDRVFEASTALRFHIGELLVSLGVRLAAVSIFGLSIGALLIFELVFQFCNILIHGNIRMAAKLEKLQAYIFVTPAHHRKHHSLKFAEINSNYGTVFTFWDRLGSSYKESYSSESIIVGIPNLGDRSLMDSLLQPFRKKVS